METLAARILSRHIERAHQFRQIVKYFFFLLFHNYLATLLVKIFCYETKNVYCFFFY